MRSRRSRFLAAISSLQSRIFDERTGARFAFEINSSRVQRILINGAWVDACSSASREIRNPATLEPLATVPECGIEDVRRAVEAAKRAHTDWRKVPGTEKRDLLRRICAHIRARADALAALMTQETGNPLCESFDCVEWAAACFEYHAEAARSRHDEPCGVVAAITPFSFPLMGMASKLAPAIAAGNAVVCKPPPQNPLAALKLAEIHALLPPGVINVVTGGADTGMALVDHPDVDRVAFIGSTRVGRQIVAAAGARPMKIDLELGSASAILVLEDADLDIAVPGVASARLRHSGQDCTSSTRIYVEKPLAAEFADRLHEYMAYLEVGDPAKLETDLGPLISLEAARRVEGQVARVAKEGARLKLGGRCFRPWGLPGHFFQPTILTEARLGSAATREDILGPVLLITPVASAREAVRFANEQGCQRASIYSRRTDLPMWAMESLKGGIEHIAMSSTKWFPYRDRRLPRISHGPADSRS
jgi:acyl-CoA reductase-like NAD-dependent aldehyde dehydrogenase